MPIVKGVYLKMTDRYQWKKFLFLLLWVVLSAKTATLSAYTGGDGDTDLSPAEVRDLVNQARETYFAGNFEDADELLARARFLTADNREDSEITYWLTLVRGARSRGARRVIPVTAPLYAEMSQLLSDAKRAYDEGLGFIETNQQETGLAKLTEARQKTREVKLLFPVNAEADFLELRIDRMTDPAAFDRSFKRWLSEAVAGVGEQSLRAFEDLQSLALLNPRYPGMADILEQAEIVMGYRPPPPSSRDLALSRDLAVAAQAIVSGHNQARYLLAREQVDQALRLDPRNDLAVDLKARIQAALAEMGALVPEGGAEQEYQRAVRELHQGNPLTALSIVQQLLQEPRYRNSPKLIALRRRIESVL
jgi:tetratricopeptide (TPR) repeat protein